MARRRFNIQIPPIKVSRSLQLPHPKRPSTWQKVEYSFLPPIPTRKMLTDYVGPPFVSKRDWIDHRQQYVGRKVALGLHPRIHLLSRVGDTWTFRRYTPKYRDEDRYGKPYQVRQKDYTFDWPGDSVDPWITGDVTGLTGKYWGVPDPRFGLVFITLFQWAAWFMANGTYDDLWIPIPRPSISPHWNILGVGKPWVNYPL